MAEPPDWRGDDWNAQIEAAADKPLEMAWLADRIAATADITRARALCAQALALAPDEPEIQTIAADLFSEGVPAWHAAIRARPRPQRSSVTRRCAARSNPAAACSKSVPAAAFSR